MVDDRDPPTDLYPVLAYLADYYPFGWMLPDRKQLAYRYGYQGNEEDPETGWTAFQLRMYDGRIGRWMSFDPARQFSSPYVAMGNQPVLKIDPDGAEADGWDIWLDSEGNFLTATWNDETTANRVFRLTDGPQSDELYKGLWEQLPITTELGILSGLYDTGPNGDLYLTSETQAFYDKWNYILSDYAPGTTYLSRYLDASKTEIGGLVYSFTTAEGIALTLLGGIKPSSGLNSRPHIWSSTKNLSPVQNAYSHYKTHGKEFGHQNALQYVRDAHKFVDAPPKGTLSTVRSNGDVVLYHAKSNTFAVKNANGEPRTMFRPTSGIEYYWKQVIRTHK